MAEPLLRLGCGGIRGCEIDQKWGQFEYSYALVLGMVD
jgi:hypothetical protein